MAHEAKLKVKGNNAEYDVIECEYEFEQPINDNGQPAGNPSGGEIRFVVQTPIDDDLFFHGWMQSPTEHKNGEFEFTVINLGKHTTRIMRFYHAYCVRLHEYIKEQDEQMLSEITLNASTITFGKEDVVVFGEEDDVE
jgi:hypothetical protein